jgi:dethiobiotin synthetase
MSDGDGFVKALFVTATGTDIGKTFVSAGLLRHAYKTHQPVRAFKPVVSGFDLSAPQGSDPAVMLEAMGQPVTREALTRIAPLQFRAALAPTMAARLENKRLELDMLTQLCRTELAKGDPVLIEGAGGLMSPIAENATCLDLAKALDLPCLLVCGTYLGAISHTLTAIETLRANRIALRGVVLNETAQSPVSLRDTADELRRFSPGLPLAELRRDEQDFAALARLCGF